jgi:hypothetical protein
VMTALKSLITDAINRELSPSAPIERLQTGELILDREPRIGSGSHPPGAEQAVTWDSL